MRAATTRRTLLSAVAALTAAATLAACGSSNAAAEGEKSLGQADAPVTVVEYASLTCGACAVFNEQTFPAFKKKYVDTGQVRYVFREFLTPPQEVAAAGFLIARCAGDDRYFNVVDTIFRSQQEMFAGGGGNVRPTLLRIAQSAGVSEQEFNTCVSDGAALEALQTRVQAGVSAGVTATPTFLVNGRKLEGVQTLADLDAAIAAARR